LHRLPAGSECRQVLQEQHNVEQQHSANGGRFIGVVYHRSSTETPGAPTVLVVEDDAMLRLVTVEFLSDSGFRVFDAENAAGAVALLSDDIDFDAVFSDIQMPGAMNGLDLARWIAREKPDVKVLLTSGVVPSQPGHPVLGKPYEMASLARRLTDIIRH
jgi:two-component system, response regulator PdtaR